MGIPAISGLNSRAVGQMYTSQRKEDGEKFTLTEAGKQAELQKLDMQLEKGEITQSEYNKREAAIKSAPTVVYVDKENVTHEGLLSADSAIKKQEKEAEKLKRQYENGEISQFSYNANMYLMTNPISNTQSPTDSRQRLSVMA